MARTSRKPITRPTSAATDGALASVRVVAGRVAEAGKGGTGP